ncbi:hypothetical protein [Candidatus Lokiarchaeum ossiferum]|uniref:hypothetical protein n=1 Tax=Candidatus Lokiarchaeum ossiferum TaxID=2951803 RepID=UPI00352CA805
MSEKFQDYEEEIIKLIVKSQEIKWRTPYESHILAFLLIYKNLSQKQIRELSLQFYQKNGKYGISVGLISKILNNYLELHFITAKSVNNPKNALIYSIESDISMIMKNRYKNIYLEIVSAKNFLVQQNKRIEKYLNTKNSTDGEQYQHLNQRLISLISYFTQVLSILEMFQDSKQLDRIGNEIECSNEKISNFQNFELEIFNFLIKLTSFYSTKDDFTKIFVLFVLRKRLTQTQIKTFLGLSSGQISLGVSNLLQKEVVSLEKNSQFRPTIRTKVYIMDNIKKILLKRLDESYAQILRDYERMKLIFKTLTNLKDKFKTEPNYPAVMQFLKNYIEFEPKIKKMKSIIGL